MSFHLTINEAKNLLLKEGHPFISLMRNGSMSIEYYAPKEKDLQSPHGQDEIYVIASGEGSFTRAGEKIQFSTGDVLFVPAGMEHRFENFSEDFATWVIFYGQHGGESSGISPE